MAKNKKEIAKKAPAKKTEIKAKANKASAPKSAKAAPKPVAKSTKKPEPKVKLAITKASKGDKKSEVLEVKAEINAGGQTDEDEDEEGAAGPSVSAAGLAMAAATAGAETSAGSLKNFRHHPDIENFYRFIFENDLRYEALEIIDVMATQREAIKQAKAARARPN
jgi:hypothetical protein